MYCIAKKANRTPTVGSNSDLIQLFPSMTAIRVDPINDTNRLADEHKIKKRRSGYHPELIEEVKNNSMSWLSGCNMYFKYFTDCENEVRSELTINSTIQDTVNRDIYLMAKFYIVKHDISMDELTFVGVHVRRGDMEKAKFIGHIKEMSPASYIIHAIEYYNNKYKWPLFIITSENIQWCKDNILSSKNNLAFSNYSAEMFMYDFSLLASCNHSIITVGTFGWFSAWLARGEVVYYKKFINNKGGEPQDYYPAHWHGMV